MADKLPISLGILSWGAHKTLSTTLDALAKEDIFSLFAECFIFFQEISDADKMLADKYNLQCHGDADNLGIMGGMERIAELSACKYVLHLENDLQFCRDYSVAAAMLGDAVSFMDGGMVDFYRLGDRTYNTEGYLKAKYLRYHAAPELGVGDSMIKSARRFLNPMKAKRLLGHCIYFSEHPEKIAPAYISKIGERHWKVNSAILNWTNQTPLYPREWFIKTVLPFARSNLSSRMVNNKPDLEKELNCAWWRRQQFRIGICDGLFRHIRYDRPDNDEKIRMGR